MSEPASDPFAGKSRALAITAVASFAAIAASVIRSKTAALILGPSGVGTIAEVSQVIAVLAFPLGVASGPALIAALSRHAEEQQHARRSLQTAIRLTVGAAIALFLLTLLATALTNSSFLDSAETKALLTLAGTNAGLNALLGVATAALIALGRPEASARATLRLHVLAAIMPSLATLAFGLVGQLAGMLLALAVTIPAAFRTLWLHAPELRRPKESFDWKFIRLGLVLGAAGLFAAGMNQGLYTAYRALAHAAGGSEANGQLQAAFSISSAYFGFVLSSLGAIAFPAFAAARDPLHVAELVRSTISQILRWVPPIILLAFAFCRPLIEVLYSGQFGPASEILAIQMAGDLPKAVAWALAGPLLLRGHVRAFIVAEFLASGALIAAAWILVPLLGIRGFGPAYVVGYSMAVVTNGLVLRTATGATVPWRWCLSSIAFAAVLMLSVTSENRIAVELFAGLFGVVWAVRVGALSLVARIVRRIRDVAARMFQSLTGGSAE